MKIFLLSDYFYPFNPGGAEWSVFELAKSLKGEKVEPIVVTLNYGAREEEVYKGIRVLRLPFAKKLTDQRSTVNPIWQNNPIFFLSSAYHLFKLAKNEKPQVLHCHGKFLIPAAVIVGFTTCIPVVITIRDKQILCTLGKCFFKKDRFHSCNLWEYLTSDIPWFFQNYHEIRNPITFCYFALGALYNRLMYFIVKLFANSAKVIIAASLSHKKYLEANGFSRIKVIYNNASFPSAKSKVQKNKSILFAGKLSKGKGGELLINVAHDVIKKNKIQFIFAGSVELKKLFNKKLGVKSFKKYIKILSNASQQELAALYTQVSATIMPSVYPESFGRAALESISYGTPAIVTNIGGLPEIMEDKVTGRVVEPTESEIKKAISDVVQNEQKYKQNIKKRYAQLKRKFHDQPLKQHIRLYRGLIK